MSLKWFHIVFISLSMLVSIWLRGLGAVQPADRARRLLSLAGSAGLCVYGNYFLGKVRDASLGTLGT